MHKLQFLLRIYCVVGSTILILTGASCGSNSANSGIVQISDTGSRNVFPAGKPFTVEFSRPDSAINGTLFWRDYTGELINTSLEVNNKSSVVLTSPDSQVGYYGLVYKTNEDEREYGFVIQPARPTSIESSTESQLGMVHADYSDKNLPAWIKTLTWRTNSPRWWAHEIQNRRDQGKIELPLISGYEWTPETDTPISEERLLALEKRLTDYISADPNVIYWELGREENLKEYFSGQYYWSNLHRKVLVARQVANQINPDIKFVYQIGGRSLDSVTKFAMSEAADVFDVLTVHPYPWPDFPRPETWLNSYLDNVDQIMMENNRNDVALWFTEIGIPQFEDRSGGNFTMPNGKSVRGSGWYEAAVNLIKIHAISLSAGIDKVFWYNYRDRDSATDDPENYFGLLDYEGFPRPVYASYTNMVRLIEGKQAKQPDETQAGIYHYTFEDEHEVVSILWTDPERSAPFNTEAFSESGQNLCKFDMIGRSTSLPADRFTVSDEPVYIVRKKQATRVDC